jgi:hypothetical protein
VKGTGTSPFTFAFSFCLSCVFSGVLSGLLFLPRRAKRIMRHVCLLPFAF